MTKVDLRATAPRRSGGRCRDQGNGSAITDFGSQKHVQVLKFYLQMDLSEVAFELGIGSSAQSKSQATERRRATGLRSEIGLSQPSHQKRVFWWLFLLRKRHQELH